MTRYPVAILGAGITGLSAAWHLQKSGVPCCVYERTDRAGGSIRSVREEGWLRELGPNTLLEGSAEVSAFIEGLGLGPRRTYASLAARHRFVVRGGVLRAMPTSPLAFAATPLFSWKAKLRLLAEPLRPRSHPQAQETVADFVVRRLGREFLDYAVNPFVAGVYAGDPRRLSVRHAFPKLHALEQKHGSLLLGAMRQRNASGGPRGRILSFPNGLEELPAAGAAAVASGLRLSALVEQVEPADDGTWRVCWRRADSTSRYAERHEVVLSALPVENLLRLPLPVAAAELLQGLAAIPHPPVASVYLGYQDSALGRPLDGFGVLVPEVEGRSILGVLFSSTLFPGRTPDGRAALTAFVGGARQPGLVEAGDGELLAAVRGDLRALLGIQAPPEFVRIQRWARAIPQYGLDFASHLATYAAVERALPGLFLGGHGRDGISLASCIESGRRLAAAALGRLGGAVA